MTTWEARKGTTVKEGVVKGGGVAGLGGGVEMRRGPRMVGRAGPDGRDRTWGPGMISDSLDFRSFPGIAMRDE